MKVFNKFFGVYRVILYLFIIVYLAVAIGPWIAGVRSYVVLSASMEPTIMTGSLAYIQKASTKAPFASILDYDEPEKGDIIAFSEGEGDSSITVVHRIYAVNPDGSFVTKGDNNETTDASSVLPSQVIGKCLFSIPKIGYFTTWLQSKTGIITAVIFGLVALISSFITDENENKKLKKSENNTEVNINISADMLSDEQKKKY